MIQFRTGPYLRKSHYCLWRQEECRVKMYNFFRSFIRYLVGKVRAAGQPRLPMGQCGGAQSSVPVQVSSLGAATMQESSNAQANPSVLAQCRVWWLLGDWDALLAITPTELESHADRAEIALYLAAAQLQKNGNKKVAMHLVQQAVAWGCNKDKIRRILISGVHNSLGRATHIAGSTSRSSQHFEHALAVASPVSDTEFLSEVRQKYQSFQLTKTLRVDETRAALPEQEPIPANEEEPQFSSAQYWEERYRIGRNSGNGSYGKLAEFKANTINSFIKSAKVERVIEFGSGDGNQLALFDIPNYVGVDVSEEIVAKCRQRFSLDSSKVFLTADEFSKRPCTAELSLSLDVIFHLVEDEVFHEYMAALFAAAERFCIIYSCNEDALPSDAMHVKRRKFTLWVAENCPDWKLTQIIYNKYPHDGSPNPHESSFCDFYFYEKVI